MIHQSSRLRSCQPQSRKNKAKLFGLRADLQRSCSDQARRLSPYVPARLRVGCSGGVQQDSEQGHVVQIAHDRYILLWSYLPHFKVPNFPWDSSSVCLAQPWELASERWCPPVNIQPFEMPSEALGHDCTHVWVHQARDRRPDVVKPNVLSNIMTFMTCYSNITCYEYHHASSCQLCASKTWRVTTTSLAQSPTMLRVFGRKHRQGADENEILQFPPTPKIVGSFGVFVPLWCNRKPPTKLSWLGHPGCSPTITARLQRTQVPNRRPWVWNQCWIFSWYKIYNKLKQCSEVLLPSYKGFLFMCPIPAQKMAQRDAAGLQDMFSLSTFMSWLLPKMEVQLGKDSEVLQKILEMWELGYLGWIIVCFQVNDQKPQHSSMCDVEVSE